MKIPEREDYLLRWQLLGLSKAGRGLPRPEVSAPRCSPLCFPGTPASWVSSGGHEEDVVVHLLVILEETQEEILGEGLGDSGEVDKIRCRRSRCRCR